MSLMATSGSPWLVSDSLLALGSNIDEAGELMLARIVSQGDEFQDLPLWRTLDEVKREKYGPVTVGQHRKWVRAHRRIFDLNPAPTPLGEQPEGYRGIRMVIGIEEIYRARLRASAATALTGATNREQAIDALRALITEQTNNYNTPAKCFAAISLGQIGSHKGLDDLLAVASDQDGRRIKRQEDLESPLRGFAIIGLGLYARPYMTEQGATNHPDHGRALKMLKDRLVDKREKLEVRAAAAVALGISGRTSNLKLMIGRYEAFDDTSPLLGGYVLLGRAILGDRNVIELARAALERKPHHDETTDLLARRAAILSMGVTGAGEAIPHLVWAWDQEAYYVNREVIVALSLCGAPGVAAHVLPLLADDTNQYERAFMADAIGRLFNQDDLPPLSVFLIGSNFMMKNGLTDPYRGLENVFLYGYLIPQFEEDWY